MSDAPDTFRFGCLCGATYRVATRLAGKEFVCHKCKGEMTVPDVPVRKPPEPTEPELIPYSPPATSPISADADYDYEPAPASRVPAGLIAGLIGVGFLIFLIVLVLAVQPTRRGDGTVGGDAASAGIGLALMAFGCVMVILLIVSYLLMLIWVVRDCRARGIDGGVLWVLVIIVFHVIGLLIYLASRPQGQLAACPHCGNSKLIYSRVCPHCHSQS